MPKPCVNGCSAKRKSCPKVQRLPIKSIHINKSPIVIGNLKTITPAVAQRWSIDLEQCMKHAEIAAAKGAGMAGIWAEVFERPASSGAGRCG